MCPSHAVVVLVLLGLVRSACGNALRNACNCRPHLPGRQQLHSISGLVSEPGPIPCRWYHAKSSNQSECLVYRRFFLLTSRKDIRQQDMVKEDVTALRNRRPLIQTERWCGSKSDELLLGAPVACDKCDDAILPHVSWASDKCSRANAPPTLSLDGGRPP